MRGQFTAKIAIMMTLLLGYAPMSLADDSCPDIQGTYLCHAPGEKSYYVDLAQFHSKDPLCRTNYCFDAFLIYYKFQSRALEGASDEIHDLTLLTSPSDNKEINYWTIPQPHSSPAGAVTDEDLAGKQMHSQATCFIGEKGKSNHKDGKVKTDLTGKKILRIERQSADFKYREVRYVAVDPKNAKRILVVSKESERKSEKDDYGKAGSSTIEKCDRVDSRDPNFQFARKNGEWKAFSASIDLLGVNNKGKAARPEDLNETSAQVFGAGGGSKRLVSLQAKFDPAKKSVKVQMLDAGKQPMASGYRLPGLSSREEFRQFLKQMGFE